MADLKLAALRAEIKANPGRFYVYILSYPDGTPFYVGAGRKRRIFTSSNPRWCINNPVKLAILKKYATTMDREIVGWFDGWPSAAAEEQRLIRVYGRRDNRTGILTNLTDGGDGVVAIVRAPISDETKKKMSVAAKARPRTREDIAAMRAWIDANKDTMAKVQSDKWKDPEYRERQKSLLRGAKRSPEYSEQNRQRQLNKFKDPEFRARWDTARRAGMNKPETRLKMSEAQKLIWQRRKLAQGQRPA